MRGGASLDDLPRDELAARPDLGRPLPECSEGARVTVSGECGLWARVETTKGPAWVEMDCFFAG